ncbi:MAG: hypothetical protein AAF705_07470 [Bacteroidota bacterium]
MNKFNHFLLVLISFCFFHTCDQSAHTSQTYALAAFELGTNADPFFLPFVSKIPQAEGFTPYYKMDPGFPSFVVGLAESEAVKAPIMNKLKQYAASFENLQFAWAKNSVKVPGKEGNYYPLFLLKTNKNTPAFQVNPADINTAEVTTNNQGKNIIDIQLNEASAKIWGELTSIVSNQKNQYLALVIDNEVYNAPFVKSPILSGRLILSGFDDEDSARATAIRLFNKE